MALLSNPRFIVLLILSIFIYNLVRLYKHHKVYRNFQNIPNLQLPLEGMFVRLEGEVLSEDKSITPITETTCAFYQLYVKASYQVKRKSPSRGYKNIIKTLYQEHSKERILIHEAPKIFVEIEKDAILDINTFTQKQEEALDNYPKHAKATQYHYEEHYLEEGDEIVVFGRLVKEKQTYILKHTYSKKLPFILSLNNDTKLRKTYLKYIYINLFFVTTTLGILIYLIA